MDRETIAEMFSAFGPVAAKRMFSGFGLWSEGVCFCLVLRGGEFYLKADPITIPQFEDNGCKPFSYAQRTSGKVVIVNSFWRMPERLYDDPDELADWARAAVGAAHRAALAKPKRRRKPEADGVAPAADKSAKPRQKKPIAKAARKPARAAKAVTTTRAPKTGAKRRTTKTKAKAARGKR
jgi:DNA transformation protein and related proteins